MEITIGKLSKRTGVHIETIRYYEKIGLLPEPGRSAGGHRLYDEPLVQRLHFIHRGRELGFSLEDIRKLLTLADGEQTPCEEVLQLTLRHRQEIERKVSDLQRLSETLSEFADRCQGNTAHDCPIIEALNAEI